MKLWLVRRKGRIDYDEYDSMVVAAETELEARLTHPVEGVKAHIENGSWVWRNDYGDHSWGCWVHPDNVVVEYLGTTDRNIKGVVLASFNAG